MSSEKRVGPHRLTSENFDIFETVERRWTDDRVYRTNRTEFL
jgi:hypothetical protein